MAVGLAKYEELSVYTCTRVLSASGVQLWLAEVLAMIIYGLPLVSS